MFKEDMDNGFKKVEVIDSETNKDVNKETKPYTITDDGEVVLDTGKRIKLRRKTGAHDMVESRLMTVCIPRTDGHYTGISIGEITAMDNIRAIVSIEAINGRTIKIPEDLKDVYEIMSEFSRDEWRHFKRASLLDGRAVEVMAKN